MQADIAAPTSTPDPGPPADVQRAHEQLTASHRALREQLRATEQSAYLHALRAAYLQSEVQQRDAQIAVIRRSASWRAAGPLRAPRQLAAMVLRHGPVGAVRHAAGLLGDQAGRVRRRLRRAGAAPIARHAAIAADAAYTTSPVRSAPEVVAPRVLILAELSIPQCAKYRVWQRQEALARLGVACTVIDWRRTAECRSALQTHALAILYRVPAMPEVVDLLGEARRLNVTTHWEVDDLIFDKAAYLRNRNLDTLEPKLRAELLAGVQLYGEALLACERAIASTDTLAEAMRATGVDHVTVIENGLDEETIALADAIRARRADAQAGHRAVVIGYGSGTKTHDEDFLQAAAALAALMRARPEVRLRIMGELTLPAEFTAFGARVERLTSTGYASYLERLGGCDISLAPLEATLFNDAKSNIKYMEAAILGLPSVCSPRAAFRSVIAHGQDGLLAETAAEWLAALTALVDSAALRRDIGAAARAAVLAGYAPGAIARSQVAPLVRGLDQRTRKRLRVLAVNVFFWPQSFGGATIVAEELARRLHRRADAEVFLFTSQGQPSDSPLTLLRYADQTDGGDMPVIAVRLPYNGHDAVLSFDNPEMLDRFHDVLRAVEPDVVHFHCVQGISSSILQACQDRGVPFVVTVHDAWWLCQRQFMVRGDGAYCGQTRIDLRMCEACIPEAVHLRQRFAILQQRLSGASRLLFPSEFHRSLYLANDAAPGRALLNRNGVRLPERPRGSRAPGPLRFGYVGGNEQVKGIQLIRKAFEALDRDDYELCLVDNTLNLGFRSMHADDWKLAGRLRVAPAYQQDTMDAFFEGIDVLLFPSQWKESFGLTVREALLRDVWVIATDGGGTVEDIVDGVNGTVIPLNADPKPLLAAVAALLDRPGGLAGYRNPHKDRIVTYDAQAEELHAVLSEVARAPQDRQVLAS